MSAKKFRFVSPGVFINEIDKSQLPRAPEEVGPVIIGRTQRGPGMVPTKVNSWSDYVATFGGNSRGVASGDVWRDKSALAPTYASYAAYAYLKNGGPVTMVRLLGSQSPEPLLTGFESAGWVTSNASSDPVPADNGGAYGLVVIPSGSTSVTGSLAAVFYLERGAIRLVGDDLAGNPVGSNGAAVFVASRGSSYEFQAVIEDQNGNPVVNTAFNFNPNSSKYIRKVFNTNPTLANADITPTESLRNYWLGESFEGHLRTVVDENSGSAAGDCFAAIVALENNTVAHADHQGVSAQPAKTGWIIAQDISSNTGSYDAADMPKLMRFVVNKGDGSGEWEQDNIKVSILDIKPSTNQFNRYGSFTVAIRSVRDMDSKPEFLEVFTGCTLDPSSPDYVARRIGDQYIEWSFEEKRHKQLGSYPNLSKYIRVEMNPTVEAGGIEPELLPFGFFGPPRYRTVTITSGSAVTASAMIRGTGSVPYAPPAGGGTISAAGLAGLSVELQFPTMQLVASSRDASVLDPTDTYFGVRTAKVGSSKFDEDYRDLVRAKPDGVDSYDADPNTEASFVFSLDDVRAELIDELGSPLDPANVSSHSIWMPGSRASGVSMTAVGDLSASLDLGEEGYKVILSRNDRFTMPLFGGFDGLDITEKDPFRNTFLSLGNGTDRGNYAVHTVRQAIDSVADPELVECNLMALPGVTNPGVVGHLMNVAEARGDALAIVDLPGGYVPAHEGTQNESQRLGSTDSTVNGLRLRALNTSYACTYYPWVSVVDPDSGAPLWVPPSIPALGTMASSTKKSELWFAPAGFNRGGLTEGSAGLQVTGVREKLSGKQRDKLYENNVNPIASFPSEGIVIFGQKTLQVTPSALDRINVRRLVIYLRKEISRISARLIFDQNVQVTWQRFLSQVNPLLESVQSRFGVSKFKVVLDESTTTEDLVDRNIMYAKVFIAPTRSAEFIAIDMIITKTGASFEDL
jgi:hypothetical protein